MKACPDPTQAVLDAFSGTVSRGLLAMGALGCGSMAASFPDVGLGGMLWFCFPPMIAFFVMHPLGLLSFISAWACFIWFIRYDGGKWVLLTLFSASTYGPLYLELESSEIREEQTWEVIWRDFHWPLLFPFIGLAIVVIPDIVNWFRRKSAAR